MNKLQNRPFIKKETKNPSILSVHNSYSNRVEKRTSRKKFSSKKIKYTKETCICYGLGCLIIGGTVGIVSSLIGHTLLEQTRRDQIQIKEKVVHLKKEISYLKGKIDKIKYHENMDKWAESKGMINDRLLQPNTEKIITPDVLKDAYIASF